MNLSEKNKATAILRCLPAIFIVCVSFYLSSQPTVEMMPGFWNDDKLVHLVCFAGLSFWVAFAINCERCGWAMVALAALLVSVYGGVDEVHQSFTPGRESSVLDWVADTMGGVLGAAAYLGVVRQFRRWGVGW